jgi:UDP-N-acetylmuramyl pentapeptide phosphotransferase/UDP-N-acetylglucosamine-1-phosphate transferase
MAHHKQLYDIPNERKIHKGLIPRLGGMVFIPVIFISIAIVMAVNLMVGLDDIKVNIAAKALNILLGGCGLLIMYISGLIDDLIGMRYRNKFIVQALCALALIGADMEINSLDGMFFIWNMPHWLSIIVSVFATILIINAINFIDGIDGLAASLSIVILIYYSYIFWMSNAYMELILTVSTLGVLVAFLYYNVFGDIRHNKKIFMGDTGSMSIGFLLTFLSFAVADLHDNSLTPWHNNFALAFSPFIIPCLDVVRVVLERIYLKRTPFRPDRRHIHHLMISNGLSPRLTVATITILTILLTGFNVWMAHHLNITYILLIDTIIYLLLIYSIKAANLRSRRKEKKSVQEINS